MDAEAAAALVEIAEEARARTRRQDLGATAEVEARYPTAARGDLERAAVLAGMAAAMLERAENGVAYALRAGDGTHRRDRRGDS